MEKNFKKHKFFIFFFVLLFSYLYAEENPSDFGFDYYDSITTTPEFKERFFYKPVSFQPNNLVDDVKVSIVQSIPFAFLYTFAYIFLSEAVLQGTWQPKMKTLEEYKETYIKTSIIFSIINISFNSFTYYNKKERKDEKK